MGEYTDKRHASRLYYLYPLLTTSIWGSFYVVTRIALRTIPPITLFFLRYLLAFATLESILAARRRKGLSVDRIKSRDWKYVAIIGVLGYFLGVCVQVVGTKYAGASIASLINAMNPVCITFLAAFMLKETLSLRKTIALVVAVSGAYVILGRAGSSGEALGVVLSILSVVLWSFSSVVVRKLGDRYDPLFLTTWCLGIATVCALPAAGVELSFIRPRGLFSWASLWCVLYLGLISALSNFLWNKSLSMLEASTCSLFYPVQPLVSVLLGLALLGERVDGSFILGSILVVGGVLFVVIRWRPRQSPR
jgi:drug/metabolite transporter (DMT)-like permease